MNSRMRFFQHALLVKLARLSNTHQNAKPNLYLIEPGTMLWSEVKDNLMSGVTQEGGSSWHGFENARFPLTPKSILFFDLCDKPHQRFRLMCV